MKGFLKRKQAILGVAVLAVIAAAVAVWMFTLSKQETFYATQSNCTVSSTLVNSCRAWLGATVGGYPQVSSDINSQINFFNKRLNDAGVLNNPSKSVTLNKKMDMAHVYHPQGTNMFSGSVKNVLNNSAIPYVFVNWKPLPGGYKWKDAGGNNSTVNNYIAQGAQSVKGLGSRKIFLTIWHEPENDVSSGNCTSNANGASMGSPSEYVAMWKNVRSIFNAQGVNNVVWVINFMGFSNWDCLIPKLWPGNEYVDWIVYDQYGSGTSGFKSSVERFYKFLNNNSNSTTNYNSKPWGLAEHGYGGTTSQSTDTRARQYWLDGKTEVQSNTFPKIKMWLAFDTSLNGLSRVGYTFSGAIDTSEQSAFNEFGTAVLGSSTSTPTPPAPTPTPPPPTPTPPTPTPTVPPPSNNTPTPPTSNTNTNTTTTNSNEQATTSSGAVNVQVEEKVDQGQQVVVDPEALEVEENVVKVEYYSDGELVQVVTDPPFAFDSGLLLPGDHKITQHTYFSDGSGSVRSESVTIEHAKQKGEAAAPKLEPKIVLSFALPGLVVVGLGTLFILFRRGIIGFPF